MTAVNLEDIGAEPPAPVATGGIPTFAQPMPIDANGAPIELAPRVAVTPAPPPPPPAVEILHPSQPGLPAPLAAPLPLDGSGHAIAGHPASHHEAHAIGVRARAHHAATAAPDQHQGQVFVDQEEGGVARLQGAGDKDPFTAPLPAGAKEGMWIPDPRIAGNGPDDLQAPNLGPPAPPLTPEQTIAQGGQAAAGAGAEMVANAEEKARIDAENKGRLAEEKQRQVDEQIHLQQQHDDAIATAEYRRDQERAKLQGFQFHDHFEGHTGRRVIAAIGLALGGDPAILDRKIQQDFARQNAELKRRQESAGEATGDVRALAERHREEWQNLKFRQGAALEAVSAKLDQEAAASNGRIDVTAAKMLAQKYRTQAAEQDLKAQHDIASIHLLKAQTAHAYAQAAKERAAGGGGGRAEAKANQAIDKDLATLEKATRQETIGTPRTLGFVAQLDKIQATKKNLQDALRSGNPSQLRAATDAVKEAIGPTLSGGRTTQFLGQTISDTKTLNDKLEELKGKITGNPAAGKAYGEQLVRLITQAEGTTLTEVDAARNRYVQRVMGPGGIASTPAAKAKAQNLHDTIFGGVKSPGGGARYGGEGAAAPAPAQRPPMMRLPNGTVLRLQADGTYK